MSKVRTIAIANQKGGVGKTTTVVNLSASLGEAGKKVLVVDADAQGNTTSGLGLEKNALDKTLYNVLLGEITASDATLETIADNVFIIPSNMNLSGAEIELVGLDNREHIMRECISEVKKDFDFVIIDCPPSLGVVTINALAAADTVLVPVQCEYFALEGMEQLFHTIGLVQNRLNPDLEVEGVAFTMFDSRTNLSLEVVEEVKKVLKPDMYSSIIPRNVRLGEAPSYGLPITIYDPKSKGAESYRELAEKVMDKEWN
ncbi:Sporulation initiation inhibitor protein Soj [bioreactor metagenome]|uniref:Sporulation initiation inhibitor protein Soj n=1 Tax=bioreactor metagenome TaxID=1076179 RepID=A0A644YJP1_9ZZZZ|nr:AAA family ATPase [Candidatus Metalachnospira sp.]